MTLSVVVTTFNNIETLGACLRSVAFADELIVLDSGSTDGTIALACRSRATNAPLAANPSQQD
jgi:glycosyltransferase involved in cell wall biosynthesis